LQGVVCRLKALAALAVTKEARRSQVSAVMCALRRARPRRPRLSGATTAKHRRVALLVGAAIDDQLLVVYFRARPGSRTRLNDATQNVSPRLRGLARLGANHGAATFTVIKRSKEG